MFPRWRKEAARKEAMRANASGTNTAPAPPQFSLPQGSLPTLQPQPQATPQPQQPMGTSNPSTIPGLTLLTPTPASASTTPTTARKVKIILNTKGSQDKGYQDMMNSLTAGNTIFSSQPATQTSAQPLPSANPFRFEPTTSAQLPDFSPQSNPKSFSSFAAPGPMASTVSNNPNSFGFTPQLATSFPTATFSPPNSFAFTAQPPTTFSTGTFSAQPAPPSLNSFNSPSLSAFPSTTSIPQSTGGYVPVGGTNANSGYGGAIGQEGQGIQTSPKVVKKKEDKSALHPHEVLGGKVIKATNRKSTKEALKKDAARTKKRQIDLGSLSPRQPGKRVETELPKPEEKRYQYIPQGFTQEKQAPNYQTGNSQQKDNYQRNGSYRQAPPPPPPPPAQEEPRSHPTPKQSNAVDSDAISALKAELEHKDKLLAEREEKYKELEYQFLRVRNESGRKDDKIDELANEVKEHKARVFYRYENEVRDTRILTTNAIQEKNAALRAKEAAVRRLEEYKLFTKNDRKRIEFYDRMCNDLDSDVTKAAEDCGIQARVKGCGDRFIFSYVSQSSKEIISLQQSEKRLQSTIEELNAIVEGMKKAQEKKGIDAGRKLKQINEDAATTRGLLKTRGQEVGTLENTVRSKDTRIRQLTAELKAAKMQNEQHIENAKADSAKIRRLEAENESLIRNATVNSEKIRRLESQDELHIENATANSEDIRLLKAAFIDLSERHSALEARLETKTETKSTTPSPAMDSALKARMAELEQDKARLEAENKSLKAPVEVKVKPRRLRKRDFKNRQVKAQLNMFNLKVVFFLILCFYLSVYTFANWDFIFSEDNIAAVVAHAYYLPKYIFMSYTTDKWTASNYYVDYIMAGGSDLCWLLHS